MDIETADAIGTLGDEIRRVETTLRGEIQRVESSLTDEVRRVETTLRGEMHGMRDELRGEMHGIRDDLRGELRAGLTENRRHAEVLTESLRDDIRIVAEGVAVVSAKLDLLGR